MTLQEARKVIGLNIHSLNGSMQMAVATIMDKLEEWIHKNSLQQEQPCGDLKIALIQQEITRLYDKYSGKNILGPECIVLDKLDEFIDTLKEKSSSTDLDEEIKRYIPRDQCPVPDLMEAVAHHFANWQKQQDESRRMANIKLANTDVPVDTDMEIAFNDIWQDCEVRVERDGSLDEETTEAMKALCHDFFESGKEWQKGQMLKEAVEGVAEELYNDGESHCTVGVGTYFKPGDEVYVIKKED